MEPYSDPRTTPTYRISDEERATPPSENERTVTVEVRQRTPSRAIIDFDGNVQTVRAHSLHRLCCGRKSLTFLAHVFALAVAMITGLVMMVVSGTTSPDFGLWSAIFSIGLGGFLPQPKQKRDKLPLDVRALTPGSV